MFEPEPFWECLFKAVIALCLIGCVGYITYQVAFQGPWFHGVHEAPTGFLRWTLTVAGTGMVLFAASYVVWFLVNFKKLKERK